MSKTFSRLAAGPSKTLIDEVMNPTLHRDYELFFEPLMAINDAHVLMLSERGILDPEDVSTILAGLAEVRRDLTPATLVPELDLYFNVERALQARIGAAAGRMHTARSRNDLQACYQRIAVRDALAGLCRDVLELRAVLVDVATRHVRSIMPGYTHTQPAQPITFGHYLLGVHDALARDTQRLFGAWQRTNLSPLGACALATTGFGIDRQRCADLLGFDGLVENSIDAVASRDYVLEALGACVGAASTISRASADLITWSAWEYGFVEIADELASGSSIMPQKKNPLALEHTRAKLAHVLAAYTSVATLTKGLPFTHTRDTGSEAFHLAFDGFSETGLAVRLFAETVRTLIVHVDRMTAAADAGFATATELADTLVRRCGLPFRTAHDVVGSLVADAVRNNVPVSAWTLEDLRRAGAEFQVDLSHVSGADLATALDPPGNVEKRSVTGGPAPCEVTRALTARRVTLEDDRVALSTLMDRVETAARALEASRAQHATSGGGV